MALLNPGQQGDRQTRATEIKSQPIIDNKSITLNDGNPFKPGKIGAPIHALLVERLLLAIRKRCGISRSDDLNRKLHRFFDGKTEGYESLEEWVTHMESLDANSAEWVAFVESILIHETYFYRDKGQLDDIRFNTLPPIILKKKMGLSPSLRIWSAACSTGEETYTIAMLALEALIKSGEATETSPGNINVKPEWNIEILGTDISWVSIIKANEASYVTYGLSAFRDMPNELERFFEPKGDSKIGDRRQDGNDRRGVLKRAGQNNGERREDKNDRRKRFYQSKYLQVKQDIRKLAKFKTHNLFSGTPPGSGYDIIFCRNALIYFDNEGKRQIQLLLAGALAPGGYLVLGPSDTLLLPDFFETKRSKNALYYQKNQSLAVNL